MLSKVLRVCFRIPLPAPPTNGALTIATLNMFSRPGAKRGDMRFNTRGVDDDGNAANFVEVTYIISERPGLA